MNEKCNRIELGVIIGGRGVARSPKKSFNEVISLEETVTKVTKEGVRSERSSVLDERMKVSE